MKIVLEKVRKDKHRVQKSPRVAGKDQGSVFGGLKLPKLSLKIPNFGGKSKKEESSKYYGVDPTPLLDAHSSDGKY